MALKTKNSTINIIPNATAAKTRKNIAENNSLPLNRVNMFWKNPEPVVCSGLLIPSLTASFTDLVKSSNIVFSFLNLTQNPTPKRRGVRWVD